MTEKLVKSDAEWRAELDPKAYEVLRNAGTERAWSGVYSTRSATGSPLPRLRRRSVPLGHEVRVGLGLAELLGARLAGRRRDAHRSQPRHDAHRGDLRPL